MVDSWRNREQEIGSSCLVGVRNLDSKTLKIFWTTLGETLIFSSHKCENDHSEVKLFSALYLYYYIF